MRHVHVIVTGTVQGVGFRAWTEERASGLGLGGWVRNAEDGAVEAVFAGPTEAVEEMLQRLRTGPSAARVESVRARDHDGAVDKAFSIL